MAGNSFTTDNKRASLFLSLCLKCFYSGQSPRHNDGQVAALVVDARVDGSVEDARVAALVVDARVAASVEDEKSTVRGGRERVVLAIGGKKVRRSNILKVLKVSAE